MTIGREISSSTPALVNAPAQPGIKPDPLWQPTAQHWLLDMGMLIVLAAVYSFITWRRLVGKSPARR